MGMLTQEYLRGMCHTTQWIGTEVDGEFLEWREHMWLDGPSECSRRLAEREFGVHVTVTTWAIFSTMAFVAFLFGILFLLKRARRQQEEIESRDSIFSVSHMV